MEFVATSEREESSLSICLDNLDEALVTLLGLDSETGGAMEIFDDRLSDPLEIFERVVDGEDSGWTCLDCLEDDLGVLLGRGTEPSGTLESSDSNDGSKEDAWLEIPKRG